MNLIGFLIPKGFLIPGVIDCSTDPPVNDFTWLAELLTIDRILLLSPNPTNTLDSGIVFNKIIIILLY